MSQKKIKFSTFLKIPSVSNGIARTIDISSYINNEYQTILGVESDMKTLKKDWDIIGDDIKNAITTYEKEKRYSCTTG
jgi:hypothetical protein